jgi:thiopeptide-type bacteriocin biosynthesis protein
MFSAVEFIHAAHPLLRFLCEITTARAAACAPFSWGAASRLPFLPRVRYQRTVLAPARWMIESADLPGPRAPWSAWMDGLASWRQRYSLPATVNLGEYDRRLRLDLDERAHLHLLRAELDRVGQVSLCKAPDAGAFGWFNGRAHEIVVPLSVTKQPTARPHGPQRAWSAHMVGAEHGHLPGSGEWLYLKLYGHPDRQTSILTNHSHALMSNWQNPPQWWFLRYQDPQPHLRLRFRLANDDAFAETAHRVSDWTRGLRRRGLIGHAQLDTYYPETGRFGNDVAMTRAESVFATDSAAAIAQLTYSGDSGTTHPHALIAASLLDLAISFTGDLSEGTRWLIEHINRTPAAPAPDRHVHDQAVRLANPADHKAALRAIPGGEDIATSWARRRAALTAYRDALLACGHIAPETLLPDLIHLHVVRMAGLSPDTERDCSRLSRAAALSWTTRNRGSS